MQIEVKTMPPQKVVHHARDEEIQLVGGVYFRVGPVPEDKQRLLQVGPYVEFYAMREEGQSAVSAVESLIAFLSQAKEQIRAVEA